jgi:LysR family glycine cleavage system transcriptional activator
VKRNVVRAPNGRTERVVPRSLPSVESLRCFHSGAHHLNFRRAAAEVGLTPTAFSERIRGLEEELGVALFLRTTRRVELTARGEALVGAAERALASVEACSHAVREPGTAGARLTIGTRFELGLSWLVPAFVELERKKPHLVVDSYFGSGADIVDRLERGLVDGIVTSAPLARDAWHTEVLHAETYEFVGSAALLAERPFTRVSDAKKHTLLDIDDSLPLARYLLSAEPGLEFAHVRSCGVAAAIVLRVLSGSGVAVLPTYMIRGELASRRFVRLLPRARLLSDSFRLLHRKGHRFSPALGELAEFLRGKPLS